MALRIGQDQLVRENVVRAQEMRRNIEDRDFNLEKVSSDAHQIYCDGTRIIRAQVLEKSLVTEALTPVMVELNKVTGLPQIQHNLHVLIPILKAHRTMTELIWVDCWRNQKQPNYTEDRDAIFRIVKAIKAVLPREAKMERGILLSPIGAQYEAACLNQAAKCLYSTDRKWGEFISSLANITGSIAAVGIGQIPDLGSMCNAMANLVDWGKKEWVSHWYLELFPLEWQSTVITRLADFKSIEAKIQEFTGKGGKYTIGLVKILARIFQNSDSEPALKEKAFQELIKLVTIMPNYSIKAMLSHPKKSLGKLRKKPDCYAATRSFAAVALLEIYSKPEYKAYHRRIKAVIKKWNKLVKDKTSKAYVLEKKEAQERIYASFNSYLILPSAAYVSINSMNNLPIDSMGVVFPELTVKRIIIDPVNHTMVLREEESNHAISTKAGPAVLDDDNKEKDLGEAKTEQTRLKSEIEACRQEIDLAEAFETLESKESDLIDEILKNMG